MEVEYLGNLLTGLVSFPESIEIIKSVDEMGVLLTIDVAKEDKGKVIGKKGATINAIRHIMKCFGYGVKQDISVKIKD